MEEKTGPPSGEGTGGKDGQRHRLVGEKGLIRGSHRSEFRRMIILLVLGLGIEPMVLKHSSKCPTTVLLDIRN